MAADGHLGGLDPQVRRNPVFANGAEVESGFLLMPEPPVGVLRGRSAFDKAPRSSRCLTAV